MSAASSDYAWAVGPTSIWYWDGKLWRKVPNPVADQVGSDEEGNVYGWLEAVDAHQYGTWITGPVKGHRYMVASFTPGTCTGP